MLYVPVHDVLLLTRAIRSFHLKVLDVNTQIMSSGDYKTVTHLLLPLTN